RREVPRPPRLVEDGEKVPRLGHRQARADRMTEEETVPLEEPVVERDLDAVAVDDRLDARGVLLPEAVEGRAQANREAVGGRGGGAGGDGPGGGWGRRGSSLSLGAPPRDQPMSSRGRPGSARATRRSPHHWASKGLRAWSWERAAMRPGMKRGPVRAGVLMGT